MGHQYALEKLGSATYSMATGRGDLKSRLYGAYLSFMTLSEKDFADEYKDDWNFINDSLKAAEVSPDDQGKVRKGRVQTTLDGLDEETCVSIAERICNLEARLRDAHST